MNTELVAQILTVGGPVALIAILSISINYKIFMRWIDQIDTTHQKLLEALGEVTESLRRMNGK